MSHVVAHSKHGRSKSMRSQQQRYPAETARTVDPDNIRDADDLERWLDNVCDPKNDYSALFAEAEGFDDGKVDTLVRDAKKIRGDK